MHIGKITWKACNIQKCIKCSRINSEINNFPIRNNWSNFFQIYYGIYTFPFSSNRYKTFEVSKLSLRRCKLLSCIFSVIWIKISMKARSLSRTDDLNIPFPRARRHSHRAWIWIHLAARNQAIFCLRETVELGQIHQGTHRFWIDVRNWRRRAAEQAVLDECSLHRTRSCSNSCLGDVDSRGLRTGDDPVRSRVSVQKRPQILSCLLVGNEASPGKEKERKNIG